MVAVQPTRGLDVGAIEAVHRVLLERRAAGAAILLISEELDEILPWPTGSTSCTRAGSSGSFAPQTADIHEIGLLMTGGGRPGGPATPRRRRPAEPTA